MEPALVSYRPCSAFRESPATILSPHDTRTGGRAAEGTGLLNRRTGYTGTAGSNPALSALKKSPFHSGAGFSMDRHPQRSEHAFTEVIR